MRVDGKSPLTNFPVTCDTPHWPNGGGGAVAGPHVRLSSRNPYRTRRHRQNQPRLESRPRSRGRVRRRRLAGRAGVAVGSRPRAGGGGGSAQVADRARPTLRPKPSRAPSGTKSCSWSWTIANTSSRRSRRWPKRFWCTARTATIIATSRETLRIAGEQVYRVPPLEVPAAGRDDADHILSHSAVELFIARTKALDSGFSPRADELPGIGAICRHLDGMPLAIELPPRARQPSEHLKCCAGLAIASRC